ncbi:hypothetical protein ACFL35_14565 [Candidatus Riflebacteria bacterium]
MSDRNIVILIAFLFLSFVAFFIYMLFSIFAQNAQLDALQLENFNQLAKSTGGTVGKDDRGNLKFTLEKKRFNMYITNSFDKPSTKIRGSYDQCSFIYSAYFGGKRQKELKSLNFLTGSVDLKKNLNRPGNPKNKVLDFLEKMDVNLRVAYEGKMSPLMVAFFKKKKNIRLIEKLINFDKDYPIFHFIGRNNSLFLGYDRGLVFDDKDLPEEDSGQKAFIQKKLMKVNKCFYKICAVFGEHLSKKKGKKKRRKRK